MEICSFRKPLADTGKNGRTVRGTESGISKHLKNIFESGELSEDSVVSKMETTAADGNGIRPTI